MLKNLKFLLISLLIMSSFLISNFSFTNYTGLLNEAETTSNSELYNSHLSKNETDFSNDNLNDSINLSSYRNTYITDDNQGYTSTTNKNLPFDLPLTRLSVKSTTLNSSIVNETASTQDVPIVRIDNAINFIININFADKKKDDVIYDWSTNIRKDKTNISEKYTLSFDTWGAKQTGSTKETVSANGLKITTGEIGTGALIVQTSENGNNWTNVEKQKYSNGLYTTDVLNYYHGTTQSYFLEGSLIKKGIFVSISFFYEVKFDYTYYHTSQERYWYQYLLFGIPIGETHTVEHFDNETKYLNVCETYKFFVIEDNPDVVTFNNMTRADKNEIIEAVKPNSENEEEYQSQSEQYQNYLQSIIDCVLPTMYDGDMSTTGIRINVTTNPNIVVDIIKNGRPISTEDLKNKYHFDKDSNLAYYELNESGKYDITLSSYSKKKTITLYVDKSSADEAYKRYFGEKIIFNGQAYGDNFLDYSPNNAYGNKRIFDAYSNVPVFVGPLTLNLKEQTDKNFLPLYGVVTNKSTGNSFSIDNKQITLSDYGEYEILFSTNSKYYEKVVLGDPNIQMAGDVRVYKFSFKIVGKSNDTTINEQVFSNKSFNDLMVASPSDYKSSFYGVKRYSANKGEIIVAFSNREAAITYAKKVVWSEIEAHTDANGNVYWLVPNFENPYGAKIESYSGWRNAQIVKDLAEKMVEKRYFDLTKSASYLTLKQSVEDFNKEGIEVTNLLDNLQFTSIEKSIIIWYNDEQRNAAISQSTTIDCKDVVSFIGRRNYAFLEKDDNGSYSKIVNGESDYFFIKDTLGIDSYSLSAKDELGNVFDLKYDEGLYAQLKENQCKSGLFQITEHNIYGNITAQYYVYYIEEDYQPSVLTCLADDKILRVSQESIPETSTFSKLVINDISNFIDPYSFVRITNKNSDIPTSYYSISEVKGMELVENGDYEIAIIDRFGNSVSYEFSIKAY